MRRTTAATAAGLLVLGSAWIGSTPAAADVTDGACTDDVGVTLVVDYQDLGGETIVTCVSGVEPGTSGLQILQLAGLNPEGTLHDGPSFVCRIGGRPGVNETLPLTGDPTYRERCGQTPPDGAFWSYWHADNGGRWTFSQAGGAAREAILGGYEGWSFSLNKAKDANPAPRVKPTHPVAKPTTAAPEPAEPTAAETGQAAVPTPEAPASSAPAPSQKPTKRPTVPPATASPSPTPSPSVVPTLTPNPTPTPSPSPSPIQSPTPTPTPSPSPTPTPTPSPSSTAAPTVPAEPAGVPLGTFVGIGAVAAIGAGGGIVWWRRRGL